MNLHEMEPRLHAERFAAYGSNTSPAWMAATRTSAVNRISNPELYIPQSPLAGSRVRQHGLAMWDMMAMCRSSAESNKVSKEMPYLNRVHPRKPVPSNGPWLDLRNTNERCRYVFALKDDVSIPHYIDLSRENTEEPFRLYELAHVLMHKWGDPVAAASGVKFRPYVYAKFLSTAMANLLVSKEFGLPIYCGDGAFERDWVPPSPYGIVVNISHRMLEPVFGVPVEEVLARDRVDNTVAYVFVAVHMQPPPELFVTDVPMMDLIWSMGPMRAQIIGWEFIDFVYNGPLVCKSMKSNKKVVGVHPNDLLAPELLHEYKDLAKLGCRCLDQAGYYTYRQMMDDNALYALLRSSIHPLPFPPSLSMSSIKLQSSNTNEELTLQKKAIKMVRKATVSYELAAAKRSPLMDVLRSDRKRVWSAHMKELREQYKTIRRNRL